VNNLIIIDNERSHYHFLSVMANSILMLFLFFFFCLPFTKDAASNNNPSIPSADNFDINTYRGKNLVLFIFSVNDPQINEGVSLMNDLYKIRNDYNYEVVGICLDADRASDIEPFIQTSDIFFPVFLDYGKKLSSTLKMQGTLGFYLYNKHAKIMGRKFAILTPQHVELEPNWRVYVSNYLKIGYVPKDQPVLGIKPPVPFFQGKALGGKIVNIKEIYKNKPVVIAIFSPRCEHCRKELDSLNSIYNDGDLKGKFEVVAISLMDKKHTAPWVRKRRYMFPIIIDTRRKIASLFPSFSGKIPTTFIVDRQGLINAVYTKYNSYLHDIYIMQLRKLASLPNPPLLFKNKLSGEQRCKICHEKEHIQWSLTKHSDAFLSLIRKVKDDDESCVLCHVTGFGVQGGYKMEDRKRSGYLENVQCESCHGPGYKACSAFTGNSPEKLKITDWKKLCLSCHTKKESLNFVFSKRFSRIIHSNVPDLTTMSREDRLKLIRTFREKQNIFDNPANYVGAEACKECHINEYAQWEKTAHASVQKTTKAISAPPEKIFRYNTGVGKDSGFPEPGREGVQCESCHGPGEKHLKKPEAKGHDYIVGLGGECSSCVVEQICRSCHSPNDDPNFDFDKQIENVRHKISDSGLTK